VPTNERRAHLLIRFPISVAIFIHTKAEKTYKYDKNVWFLPTKKVRIAYVSELEDIICQLVMFCVLFFRILM
jgi:hypothetical protein